MVHLGASLLACSLSPSGPHLLWWLLLGMPSVPSTSTSIAMTIVATSLSFLLFAHLSPFWTYCVDHSVLLISLLRFLLPLMCSFSEKQGFVRVQLLSLFFLHDRDSAPPGCRNSKRGRWRCSPRECCVHRYAICGTACLWRILWFSFALFCVLEFCISLLRPWVNCHCTWKLIWWLFPDSVFLLFRQVTEAFLSWCPFLAVANPHPC